ncbi:4497_t:CDS:2 [Funneliformis mosseae]|uniref:4497_t:CDS:1 n=1 Tax=Funneliformis mosseae TaxID=27381 RepID=A0A9N9D512_FUNMO|nr:4497_t:CDS:2 [Funneliformis mosseae]
MGDDEEIIKVPLDRKLLLDKEKWELFILTIEAINENLRYGNNVTSDKGEVPSIIERPNMNINLYARYNTSALAVYQLMTGDTKSIESWELNQNPTLVMLWISFSLLIVVFLLNLFIGLLSEAMQEYCNKEFLFQKADIIVEIELFWLLPCQRNWKEWFPEIIWYNVYVDELRNKILEIRSRDLYKGDKPMIHPKLLELTRMK